MILPTGPSWLRLPTLPQPVNQVGRWAYNKGFNGLASLYDLSRFFLSKLSHTSFNAVYNAKKFLWVDHKSETLTAIVAFTVGVLVQSFAHECTSTDNASRHTDELDDVIPPDINKADENNNNTASTTHSDTTTTGSSKKDSVV